MEIRIIPIKNGYLIHEGPTSPTYVQSAIEVIGAITGLFSSDLVPLRSLPENYLEGSESLEDKGKK